MTHPATGNLCAAPDGAFDIGVDAADLVLRYLDAMLVENQNVNLTGVRDVEAARMLHALDSLALAALGLEPEVCVDIGTGNEFPGIAMRALWPAARVTLIDRTKKKILAITRALEAVGVTDIQTLQLDAIQVEKAAPDLFRQCDLVTLRAVTEPIPAAKLAQPFLKQQANLVLWVSEDTPAPANLPGGLRRVELYPYDLPAPADRSRRLAHYQRG